MTLQNTEADVGNVMEGKKEEEEPNHCEEELEMTLEDMAKSKEQDVEKTTKINDDDDYYDDDDDDDDPRRKHWKESEFAVGLVDITWKDSRPKNPSGYCCYNCCCRAGRVGNMVVLKESKAPDGKRKLDCVMGPFWIMPITVTYPLIIGVSLLTLFRSVLSELHIAVQIVWAVLTISLIISLSCISFRNPGILYRHTELPQVETSDEENGYQYSGWVWNDQALTYRPPKAKFDGDCGVVIEHFDHTCPWTGTGIGRNNMKAFICFVSLIIICIIFDVVLLAGRSMFGL